MLAYFGSISFVYRGRRSYPMLAEAIGFFVIGLLGLGVNVLLLFAFVKLVGLSVGVAKAPTTIGVFLFNFLTRRTLLFTGARHAYFAEHGLGARYRSRSRMMVGLHDE